MKTNEIYVYIAAPFFNRKQVEMVMAIEEQLELFGIKYFSPRNDGILLEMSAAERNEKMEAIYKSNIRNLNACNFLIAVIDDYDTGTVFELGYFAALLEEREQTVVTITGNDYDLNVMLRFATDCHVKGINELHELLNYIRRDGGTNGTALPVCNNIPDKIR